MGYHVSHPKHRELAEPWEELPPSDPAAVASPVDVSPEPVPSSEEPFSVGLEPMLISIAACAGARYLGVHDRIARGKGTIPSLRIGEMARRGRRWSSNICSI